jgi:hypothetical protein
MTLNQTGLRKLDCHSYFIAFSHINLFKTFVQDILFILAFQSSDNSSHILTPSRMKGNSTRQNSAQG